MKNLLKKYQSRIINLSKRNRSLKLNRTYKRRSFDLHLLNHIFPNRVEDIYNEIIINNKTKVELLPDSGKFLAKYNKYIRKIDSSFKDLADYNYDIAKEIINEYLYDINFKLNESYENYDEIINDLKLQVIKMADDIESYSKSLNSLYYEVDFERKETGVYNLKLALNFAEGQFFAKDSYVRAPLGFLTIYLLKSNKKWFLLNEQDSEININNVLLLSARLNNNLNIVNEEFELKDRSNAIEELIMFYKLNGIDIFNYDKAKFEQLNSYNLADYKKYRAGELTYKGYLVIGQFPTANAIYHDYNKLLSLEESELKKNNNALRILLGDEELGEASFKLKEFNEQDYYYINKLDYSQEQALKNCSTFGSLVIFGPPGTGKSQTISNIVADNLAKGKRVLVVSQKKAALDVLYNRLSKLQDKICIIHDSQNDKVKFYKDLSATLQRFEARYPKDFHYKNKKEYYFDENENRILTSLNEMSVKVDNMVKDLNTVNEFLFKPLVGDFTGKELYSNAFNNESLNTTHRQLFYNFVLIKNDIDSSLFNKEDINKISSELNSDSFVIKKFKYESIKNDYPLIRVINNNISARITAPRITVFKRVNELINSYLERVASNDTANKVSEYIKNTEYKGDYRDKVEQDIDNYIKTAYTELFEPVAEGVELFFKSIFSSNKLKEEQSSRDNELQQIKDDFNSNSYFLLEIIDELITLTNSVKDIFIDDFNSKIITKLVNKEVIIEEQNLLDTINKLAEFNKLEIDLNSLSGNSKMILEACYLKIKDVDESALLVKNIKRLMITYLLEGFYNTDSFTTVKSHIDKYNKYLAKITEIIDQKLIYSQYYINVYWNNKFLVSAHDYDYREFRRLAKLKRRVRALRSYFYHYKDLVFSLYPCMLMGPKTVSEVLPVISNLFDVVVFDEASQMFIEDAIPTIFRGVELIVAGDDKQLKPSLTFRKKYDDESDVNSEYLAAAEEESLLDLAKNKFMPSQLQFHYRSRYSQLINFSNYAFYDANLQISPNRVEDYSNPPIQRVKLDNAVWHERQNTEEAITVVNLVKELLKNRANNESLGIITFNITQRHCILNTLHEEASKDDEFENLLELELNRTENNEDISLFVKNIENVQGDERDIIIFSTGYAKDENGKLRYQFGDLSKESGENRLNVAVTRAKHKVFLVTSFEPEELKLDNVKNIGPVRFKQYLQYAKYISEGLYKEAEQYLASCFNVQYDNVVKDQGMFINDVYNKLLERNYNVKKHVGLNGYYLDLAIYDDKESNYILGIECDGVCFTGSTDSRQRDIHRKNFLKSRGWNIYQMWSNDWWENEQEQMQKLEDTITKVINQNKPSS